MGLFDTNKTTTSNQTNNYDQRQVITNTTDSSTSNTTTNITDGGAIAGMVTIVGKALDGASQQTLDSYNYADSIFDAATVFANRVSSRASDAYSEAANITRDTLTGARQAYGDAAKATADAYKVAQSATADAYADAKGTTNAQKQIILGVLAVAALFALAAFKQRG